MGAKDYFEGRKDGLLIAYGIVKEGGIEELKREIEFRGAHPKGFNISMTRKECIKLERELSERILDTVLILALTTLADEFDYGKVRLRRFMERFLFKAECLAEPEISNLTWPDLQSYLKDNYGIEIDIRKRLYEK